MEDTLLWLHLIAPIRDDFFFFGPAGFKKKETIRGPSWKTNPIVAGKRDERGSEVQSVVLSNLLKQTVEPMSKLKQ